MFTINAEVRKEQGKGASRRLRAANKFPAIIYGGKEAPLAIELDHDKVMNMQAKAEFYSEVLTIVVKLSSVRRPDKAFTPHLAFRTQNRLIAARRPALQLVAQIRRRAFNGQGIGCWIPEDAFT